MKAVILAGGKGTRLAPYSTVLPKPLMPIGEMPILEVILRQLKLHGVEEATLAVGYLAELFKAYFDNGNRFGLKVNYSFEDKPLGTAGPLALVPGLEGTFLVMNGDILTDLNYADLFRFHQESGATATIATYIRHVKIDFGVIETNGDLLAKYIEKPSFTYRVSMGVYVFSPRVLDYIERGAYLDFPDLICSLMAKGEPVTSYAFSGHWLDIGRPDDYRQAVAEFELEQARYLREEVAAVPPAPRAAPERVKEGTMAELQVFAG